MAYFIDSNSKRKSLVGTERKIIYYEEDTCTYSNYETTINTNKS